MQNNSKNGKKHPGLGNSNKIKVLMYHIVTDDKSFCSKNRNIAVHVSEFRNQMKFLDRCGFVTITFEDYLLYMNGELNLPKKPIILSFDDGFADVHQYAFPILQEFGMRAVLFILGDRKIKTNSWDHASGISPKPLLADYQIIEMHDAGFEIGSHALTHSKLTNIQREKAWEEISRSRMLLEIFLNTQVKSIAYPFGSVNKTLKILAEEAGYQIGCGSYSGPLVFGKDRFEIHRINIPGQLTIFQFALRLSRLHHYLEWTWWRLMKNGKINKNRLSVFSSSKGEIQNNNYH
ncbi:MAG: polysaccharide deacetylase family protein [Bacteroidota bacterium]|nr:polysaccharide deacetylase family protein [Bacteroidota bacterium]